MDMRSEKYPYGLDVERRLPNGSLTTDGYAARHPVEFRHWEHARGYVLWGERIDRTDWENWRINYYGKLSLIPDLQDRNKEISLGFFDKIKQGLKKTSDAVNHSLDSVFAAFVKVDDDLLEELEEALILSDVGASTAAKIVAEVEKRAKLRKTTTADELRDLLREVLTDNMLDNQPLNTDGKPAVILVIGVNGVGKTTSIGKLAARYVNEGKKVMLSAADTFRAAAADQLEIWAKRAGADIVRHGEGADPAAVVFDSISAAKARGSDIIIVDTAGRLHNKANLMNELAKIDRVISRELPDASRETLLVLDATTGQNAVHQAEEFNKAAELTGIILTKLDGTAKGGIVIAISAGLGVPVKLVGVGEGIDDLIDFDRAAFLEAILPPVHENAENDEEQTEEDENAET